MVMDPEHAFHEPVVVVLGYEYGKRAGQRVQIKAIKYSLTGPVIFLPGQLQGPAEKECHPAVEMLSVNVV